MILKKFENIDIIALNRERAYYLLKGWDTGLYMEVKPTFLPVPKLKVKKIKDDLWELLELKDPKELPEETVEISLEVRAD